MISRPPPFARAMRAAATAPLALAATLALVTPRSARSEAAPIFLDGFISDWTGPVELVDPAGDGGSSGIDFREVDLANDGDFLFLRFQTTKEVGLQANGNNLVLYIDGDDNPSTGLAINGIGADLVWNFGNRTGCIYSTGCLTTTQNALRLRLLPSVTASTFEVAIGRAVKPDGVHLLFPGSSFRLLLVDAGSGGDRAPNVGGLAYTFDATPVPPPAPIAFARADPSDVRVVAWNTRDLEGGSDFDPAVTPSADRVYSALEPDILCFEEVYNASADQMRSLIQTMLPERAPWIAMKQNDCIVVSRFPLIQSWALDGNLAVLLDTDAALGADLLLVCAHLPCCTNDAGRQAEADRIMSFLRDAMLPDGVVNVPAGTAFMIAGDLNLVGYAAQLETLLTGDIADEGVFGPDFTPDWDGSALADVVSSQTERRFAYTWRDDGMSFAPGRLDFVLYTDSVLRLGNHFLVYSPEMSPAALAATGIQAGDVTTVSDHLPVVADFRSALPTAVGFRAPRGVALGSAIGSSEIRFDLELDFDARVAIDVLDVLGRRVATLFGGSTILHAGRHELVWDGRNGNGYAMPGGMYFARVTAVPTAGGPRNEVATARWLLLR